MIAALMFTSSAVRLALRTCTVLHMCMARGRSPIAELTPMADSNFNVRSAGEGRGLGLYTRVPLEASAFLFDYTGVTIPMSDYAEHYDCLSDYILSIENAAGYRFVIDAADPERSSIARYMNHAGMGALIEEKSGPADSEGGLRSSSMRMRAEAGPCNCLMLSECDETYREFVASHLEYEPMHMPPPRLHVFTLRAIDAGEELCWDYGEEYWATMAKRGKFQVAQERPEDRWDDEDE